jgi:hypothetical protein
MRPATRPVRIHDELRGLGGRGVAFMSFVGVSLVLLPARD